MTVRKGSPLNGKTFMFTTACAVVTLLSAAFGLHRVVVMPMVRAEVATDIRQALGDHSQNPHTGTVSREEFGMIGTQLARIETRLGSIEEAIRGR